MADYTFQIYQLVHGKQAWEHKGGIHTAIGDPEPGVPKTLLIDYGAVNFFTTTDYQPVELKTPSHLIIFHATYGYADHVVDVTAGVRALVHGNELKHLGGIHTAVGDPFPNIPKRLRITYGYAHHFQCADYQPVSLAVDHGEQLHIYKATYGSSNNRV